MYRIARREQFSDSAFLWEIDAPDVAQAAEPGHFVLVGGGLACAADLVKYGADVTVYEALHVVGGVLRYGIPSFRLPRDIIEREVARLSDIGVRFGTNKVVGKTFTIAQLTGAMGFDAVFIAAGAGAPAFLGIPGESAGQVFSANEFLTRVNLMGGDQFPYRDTPIGLGGVRGIEVDEGDEVIAADVVQEGAQILTVSERGYGKRTPLEEYRLQGRAGKGIIDIKTAGRNGTVVGMLQVREGDDLLIITTKGKIIRIHAGEVSSQGRNTMGVRIIDLDADDRVGSIARVEAEQAPAEAQ